MDERVNRSDRQAEFEKSVQLVRDLHLSPNRERARIDRLRSAWFGVPLSPQENGASLAAVAPQQETQGKSKILRRGTIFRRH